VPAARLICVGETLWDILPQGEFLGGAPLNVAAHAVRLGLDARLVSRIGADDRGHRARAEIERRGISTALLQTDPRLPTGIAETALDGGGCATYRFPAPCAWDAIEATSAARAAAQGATLVYGTLAQREAASAATVRALLDVAGWRVFDANLRAPHDARDTALEALGRADFVKLNGDEVTAFAEWLGVAPAVEVLRALLRADFGIRSLCVTEGARGAHLWHDDVVITQPAHPTRIADTIGAGDAFLAMLVTELLCGSAPAAAMRRSARLASFVASQPGAFPDYEAAPFRS
jgi:fructokinase